MGKRKVMVGNHEQRIKMALSFCAGAFLGSMVTCYWLTNSFFGEDFWGVLTAIGTAGSAIGAVVIAYLGNQREEDHRRKAAHAYAISITELISSAVSDICAALPPNDGLPKKQSAFADPTPHEFLRRAIHKLNKIDFEKFSIAFPDESIYITRAKVTLSMEISSNTNGVDIFLFKPKSPEIKKIAAALADIPEKILNTSQNSI